ncbi:MAG: SDR family NAD(P)-dependent oxidoreductase [Micromonosporaceae bacterium]
MVTQETLSGSVALVTGGGRGFGRVIARELASAGAAVAVTGRTREHLAEAVREIEAGGGTGVAVPMDVTDPDAVRDGVAAAADALGPIDLLVNNAGLNGPVGPQWDVDEQFWWRTVEVNLRGVALCSAAVLPSMVERGAGRLVNIASHAGVFRWPHMSAYSVSKAAVIKLTENQAYETRHRGLRVFAVHPGVLPIGLSEEVFGFQGAEGSYEAKMTSWLRRQFDEGNVVAPERAAGLIVRIATGEVDALSGRYLRGDDDLELLLAQAEKITAEDRLLLRLRD